MCNKSSRKVLAVMRQKRGMLTEGGINENSNKIRKFMELWQELLIKVNWVMDASKNIHN